MEILCLVVPTLNASDLLSPRSSGGLDHTHQEKTWMAGPSPAMTDVTDVMDLMDMMDGCFSLSVKQARRWHQIGGTASMTCATAGMMAFRREIESGCGCS